MEMDMEAEEFHGIFQFAADIDDDDDDFFGQSISKEERAMERMRKENSIATYRPQFLTGGYNIPKENISKVFFGSKNGPNIVKQAIEWYYSLMKMKENNTLTKDQSQNVELYNEISYQYIKDCCDKYLECNQSKGKLINEREILEIAIRCLIQIDRIVEIEPYVGKLDPKEPGLFAFSAKCYYLLKHYSKSLQIHQKYCDLRKNDYMSWIDMANIFKDINNFVMNRIYKLKHDIPDLYRLIYIICFVKAYKLLKVNKISKKTEYWNTVIDKELNPMQKVMDENPDYEKIVEQTLLIPQEALEEKIKDFNKTLNELCNEEEVQRLSLPKEQIEWMIKHGKATIRESDLNDDENEASCLNIY